MSWIRLLKTSRAFSSQEVDPRGYRLTQMNLIPKFGPRDEADAEVVGPASEPSSSRGKVTKNAVRLRLGQMGDRIRVGFDLMKGWLGKLRLTRIKGFVVLPREARSPFAHGSAQPELRLDAIRPVHNDLSDCEFEVRPIPSEEAGPVTEKSVFASMLGAIERVRTTIL